MIQTWTIVIPRPVLNRTNRYEKGRRTPGRGGGRGRGEGEERERDGSMPSRLPSRLTILAVHDQIYGYFGLSSHSLKNEAICRHFLVV